MRLLAIRVLCGDAVFSDRDIARYAVFSNPSGVDILHPYSGIGTLCGDAVFSNRDKIVP